MSRLKTLRAQGAWHDILEGQPQQVAIMVLMSLGAISLLDSPVDAPRFLFLTSYDWAVVSICLAGVHQLVTATVFRLQLYRNVLTDRFGDRDMQVWATIFMPLLAARPITLCLIGWTDTSAITGWRIPEVIIGIALIGVAVCDMHSVLTYFTLPRALGGDHFRDKYAAMEMVR